MSDQGLGLRPWVAHTYPKFTRVRIPLPLQDLSTVHIKTMTQNRGSQGAHQGMSWQHSVVSMFAFREQEKQKFGLKKGLIFILGSMDFFG